MRGFCLVLVLSRWQGYEPRFYYFEVVLLMYKLMMSVVTVLFLPDTLAQVCTWDGLRGCVLGLGWWTVTSSIAQPPVLSFAFPLHPDRVWDDDRIGHYRPAFAHPAVH
jgi:hypothetical protein